MAERLIVGRVSGLYGIQGWVRVFSYTEPRHGITDYDPLYIEFDGEWRAFELAAGRAHGKGVVLKFAGIDERSAAAALLGRELAISRDQLPQLEPGEYYWADLAGLDVVTLQGVSLGTVSHLFETGANDVLVVRGERERLIPFLRDRVIVDIDLGKRLIKVDWDPDF